MDHSETNASALKLYALRVEGLNFYSVIDDTHDLSAIAGGSRLLEEVPRRVKNILDGALRVVEIQRASSAGVFAFLALPARMPSILADIRSELGRGDLKHLTVGVQAIEIQGNVRSSDDSSVRRSISMHDLARLQAAIRYEQMSAPSIAIPSTAQDCYLPCEKDGFRPAVRGKLSESVYCRREWGKRFRRRVAGIGTDAEIQAARTFEELTNYPENPLWHHRLAVISIDGNHFGETIRESCKDGEDLWQFSKGLTDLRDHFWQQLIGDWSADHTLSRYFSDEIPDQADKNSSTMRVLRVQRLVTAGDDFVYLAPAWLAWDFLERFFAKPWVVSVLSRTGERAVPLTFRAGVVICHHNAPIHRVRILAHELGELAKKETLGAAKSLANPIAYEVLKSFDLIGPRLEEYRQSRVRNRIPGPALLLEGAELKNTRQRLEGLSEELPSSRAKDPDRWLATWSHQEKANAFHLSQWRDFVV